MLSQSLKIDSFSYYFYKDIKNQKTTNLQHSNFKNARVEIKSYDTTMNLNSHLYC